MRSPALTKINIDTIRHLSIIDILLCTCFRHTASNDIRHNIPWLYNGKQQLADLAQTTNGIKVRFAKSTDTLEKKLAITRKLTRGLEDPHEP